MKEIDAVFARATTRSVKGWIALGVTLSWLGTSVWTLAAQPQAAVKLVATARAAHAVTVVASRSEAARSQPVVTAAR